jgi:hypothetical protein
VRIRRTTEGKGVRSPFAPPPSQPAPEPPPAPPVDQGPSVIVEMDAGLPRLKRAEAPKGLRPTEVIPMLTPSKGSDAVKPAPPLSEAPPFDLPKIKRGPEQPASRMTDQIPVLTPQQQAQASSPQIPPPVLSLPPPPLAPPPAKLQSPTQPLTPPQEEPDEVSPDDIESVEEEAPRELDPWLAQLIFGYCPPEATPFERPAPPTTFPGRDP